ncbi:MAG: S26 family signal peptidase [Methanoregulaceae archaeon]
MAEEPPRKDFRALIGKFRTSENPYVSLARELLWVVCVVGGIAVLLLLLSGTWPAVVTIESGSMTPHMNVGDLVFVVQKDRFGELQTWDEGKASGYMKYGDYGDVIIYQPNGAKNPPIAIPFLSTGVHPIIHRAMTKTGANESVPTYINPYRGQVTPKDYLPLTVTNTTIGGYTVLTTGQEVPSDITLGPKDLLIRSSSGSYVLPAVYLTDGYGYIWETGTVSSHGGYITKGDNNTASDQSSSYQGLGQIEPVKDEWVVGKVLFVIPLVGLLPLHIVEVAIIVIVLMIAYEWYVRRKADQSEPGPKTGSKKKRKN